MNYSILYSSLIFCYFNKHHQKQLEEEGVYLAYTSTT